MKMIFKKVFKASILKFHIIKLFWILTPSSSYTHTIHRISTSHNTGIRALMEVFRCFSSLRCLFTNPPYRSSSRISRFPVGFKHRPWDSETLLVVGQVGHTDDTSRWGVVAGWFQDILKYNWIVAEIATTCLISWKSLLAVIFEMFGFCEVYAHIHTLLWL